MGEPFLYKAVDVVVRQMGDFYPELTTGQEYIEKVIRTEEERFYETLEQGMKILNERMWKVGKKGVFPGDEAFKLYDTFGFPLDLTKEILAEQDIILDEEAFRSALEQQRERGRSARSATSRTDDNPWQEISGLSTTFVGYDTLDADGRVLAVLHEGTRVQTATEGEKVEILLSETPFYGEKGGQVGDTGSIRTPEGIMLVTETVMTLQDQIIHRGIITRGAVSEGESAHATVGFTHRSAVCRNHTATHLLHSALQEVLGRHVKQAGSLVSPERLRFDFTHLSAMDAEQIAEVERLVNEKVWENLPVQTTLASLDEAKEMGATALFDEKYGEAVRIVRAGDYSMELCGGTHVSTAGEIGIFKIMSESGIGAGLRRIEALTGSGAYTYFTERSRMLEQAATQLKTTVDQLPDRLADLIGDFRELQRENQRLQLKLAGMEVDGLLQKVSRQSSVPVISARVSAGNMETLREMADRLKNKLQSGIIVLGAAAEGRVLLVSAVTQDLIKNGYHAGKLIGEVAKITGGGGGGRPDMAQAGGKNADELDNALSQVDKFVKEQGKK
jgi:alanyl-tRNA synthetase